MGGRGIINWHNTRTCYAHAYGKILARDGALSTVNTCPNKRRSSFLPKKEEKKEEEFAPVYDNNLSEMRSTKVLN